MELAIAGDYPLSDAQFNRIRQLVREHTGIALSDAKRQLVYGRLARRLRARFGLESKPFDSSTVVIVVRVDAAVGEKTVGIVVDAVSEVYNVAADAVKPTPDLGASADAACVSGLTSVDDKMVMLLDMNRLVASSIDLTAQSVAD